MNIEVLEHGSPAYEQMIQLRITVLLNPIGIPASYINREKENEDILIGAFDHTTLIGCCVLTQRNTTIVQLRQMAVAPHVQGKGIGAAIVTFAENLAKEKGYTTLMMHARSTVATFYTKSGYTITGDEFEEVGIRHYVMQKQLA